MTYQKNNNYKPVPRTTKKETMTKQDKITEILRMAEIEPASDLFDELRHAMWKIEAAEITEMHRWLVHFDRTATGARKLVRMATQIRF